MAMRPSMTPRVDDVVRSRSRDGISIECKSRGASMWDHVVDGIQELKLGDTSDTLYSGLDQAALNAT